MFYIVGECLLVHATLSAVGLKGYGVAVGCPLRVERQVCRKCGVVLHLLAVCLGGEPAREGIAGAYRCGQLEVAAVGIECIWFFFSVLEREFIYLVAFGLPYGAVVRADGLPPNLLCLSVLQQPGHFAALELLGDFGFRLPGCITSVYAACGRAGQVVAVGHDVVVLSAQAADIVVACYVAGVVAVGHGAHRVLSAYAADIVVACYAAGVVAIGHGAAVVKSAQAADTVITFHAAGVVAVGHVAVVHSAQAADYFVACYAAGVVAVGHGAAVVISAHAADIVAACYVAVVVAVGHGAVVPSAQAADYFVAFHAAVVVAVDHVAVVHSAQAADRGIAFHAAGVVAIAHGAAVVISAHAADIVATFDIACLYAYVPGSTTSEDAHQALVVCCAVDINAAYAVAIAIQGAGEWVSVTAYRRPAVCRSGGFPAFPVFGVVQHDVGSELAVDACLPAVHHRGEEAQLVGSGNQVEAIAVHRHIAIRAVVVIYFQAARYGIAVFGVEANVLPPDFTVFTCGKQPGHLAALELLGGFGSSFSCCAASVYVVAVAHGVVVSSAHAADIVAACYAASVVAVGHGAGVNSAHAADIVVAACYAASVVAVGHGAAVRSAHAADIVAACYAASVVAVGHGAAVHSAHAADRVVACYVAGVVAVGHVAGVPSAQAGDIVATFDIACLYAQVLQGSTLSEEAHQALVVCRAVDINAAYAVAVTIQGAGEWVLPAAAYRCPAVSGSGAFVPACPVGNVVQQDVGSEFAVDACLPAVHHRGEEAQLVGIGNQIEAAFACLKRGVAIGAIVVLIYFLAT